MPTIQFIGHVEPRTLAVNGVFNQTIFDPSRRISARLRINFQNSKVEVTCDLALPTEIGSLHVLAYDMCRLWINMYSFATGIGYTLHFDEVINADGQRKNLISQFVQAKELCTAYNLEQGMEEAWHIL